MALRLYVATGFSLCVCDGVTCAAGDGTLGDCVMARVYGWVTWTLMLCGLAHVAISETRMAGTVSQQPSGRT